MDLKGSQTEKNLLTAFAGESLARNRYAFYAKQAKKDGYEQIRAVFEDTAAQEMSHAKILLKRLPGGEAEITASFGASQIGTTLENLQEAAKGENYENTEMYPGFAETADREGFKAIAVIFRMLVNAESYHEKRFRALSQNIKNNTVFSREKPVRWVCQKCGYIHEGSAPPKICPLCAHPQGYFEVDAANY
ncbi:rubrerythrin [Planctomycetota bacterium]